MIPAHVVSIVDPTPKRRNQILTGVRFVSVSYFRTEREHAEDRRRDSRTDDRTRG